MGSYTLAQKELIKNRDEFQRVLKKGKLYQTKFFRAFFLRNNLGFNRIGVSCDKEVWKNRIVLRNRIKRVIKEAYRKNKHLLKPGFDIILIGKDLNKDILSTQVEKELKKLSQAIE